MDVTNSGSIPTLERALAFSWKRHEVILNNIANVSTPHFKAHDLPVSAFQKALAKAGQRQSTGPLVLGGNPGASLKAPASASLAADLFAPAPTHGIPGPDGNDVVPEVEAATLAKNAAYFSAMSQLLNRQYGMIEKAIRERI